jgi:orotidine-5'-phosphate decarboxylase
MEKKLDFVTRFNELAANHSPFCLGIDPSSALLTQWRCQDDVRGLAEFCDHLFHLTENRLAMVKLQSAYFERFGPRGMTQMQHIALAYKRSGTLVLIDGKRGDIADTASAYGQAYLGYHSPYQGDAMTCHAYLGIDALEPIFQHAARQRGYIFVVVRSSNPEGDLLQTSINNETNQNVAMLLANQITEQNNKLDSEYSVIGAVLGATKRDIKPLAEAMPDSLILTPGIGHQGASVHDLLAHIGPHIARRVIPTSARSIMDGGATEFNERLSDAKQQARLLWNLKS